jgi:hypothetical protein
MSSVAVALSCASITALAGIEVRSFAGPLSLVGKSSSTSSISLFSSSIPAFAIAPPSFSNHLVRVRHSVVG